MHRGSSVCVNLKHYNRHLAMSIEDYFRPFFGFPRIATPKPTRRRWRRLSPKKESAIGPQVDDLSLGLNRREDLPIPLGLVRRNDLAIVAEDHVQADLAHEARASRGGVGIRPKFSSVITLGYIRNGINAVRAGVKFYHTSLTPAITHAQKASFQGYLAAFTCTTRPTLEGDLSYVRATP